MTVNWPLSFAFLAAAGSTFSIVVLVPIAPRRKVLLFIHQKTMQWYLGFGLQNFEAAVRHLKPLVYLPTCSRWRPP